MAADDQEPGRKRRLRHQLGLDRPHQGVVLPVPDDPVIRMLPTRKPASCVGERHGHLPHGALLAQDPLAERRGDFGGVGRRPWSARKDCIRYNDLGSASSCRRAQSTGEALVARADLLINLVRANSQADAALFRRTLEALVAEERAKQHHVLADRLAEFLNGAGLFGKSERPPPSTVDERIKGLFFESIPRRTLGALTLPPDVAAAAKELVEEHLRKELLRSHGLEPRHRVLLVGPPGNGKTSLAEALAEALALPFIVVRYEGVIGSFLGETAVRLRRLFDYVRTRCCLLFFDEFDTLGKERGDQHDTGEIKRVVSSLLLQIDDLPSHVLVIGATNHPELLDRAVWRRFQVRLELPPPQKPQVVAWLRALEERLGEPLGLALDKLAAQLKNLSYAELEEFELDVLRRRFLEGPDAEVGIIVRQRVQQWLLRSKALALPFEDD